MDWHGRATEYLWVVALYSIFVNDELIKKRGRAGSLAFNVNLSTIRTRWFQSVIEWVLSGSAVARSAPGFDQTPLDERKYRAGTLNCSLSSR